MKGAALFVAIAFIILLAATAFAQYQPHAIWSREGAGDSSLYGSQILALGDQNGDGFNDWAVYAAGLGYAPPGSPNEPRVEFFHGGNPPDTIPYMVRVKDPATEVAVRGARALGDLNGDGYIDWYIFTSYVGDTTGRHIYKIYFGGPGPHDVPDLVISPLLCDPVGDFNGDGYDDLLLLLDIGSGVRRSQVTYGGSSMDTVPDWERGPIFYVQGYGDVNNDGFSDFICNLQSFSQPSIFLGSSRPDTVPGYSFTFQSIPEVILRDLNNDGYDELGIARSGWGEIVWGGTLDTGAFRPPLDFPCSGSGPEFMVSAGDFNHDGFNDVVMLRQYCENNYWGVLTLHLGGNWINPQPAFVIYGWTDPLNLIHFKTAVSLGDINGDHIDDLAIGANGGIEYAAQRGKVVILGGDSSLRATADEPRVLLPQSLQVVAYPNPFNSSCTISLTLPGYHDNVHLSVYNLLGQKVQTVTLNHVLGETEYHLDGSALSAGVYLLHVKAGSYQATQKLMLLL